MKISSPLFNSSLKITGGSPLSVVIENKKLFRSYVEDLYAQMSGAEGKIVLSKNDEPILINKNAEIIDNFITFDINTKAMQGGIFSALEKKAVSEEFYIKTSKLLSDIENYIYDLCFDLPFSAECKKLSSSSLIKSLQVCVADDYSSRLEALLDYMSLITEFSGEKLFIFVNMCAYFSEDEMALFVSDVKSKMFSVMFVDSVEVFGALSDNRLIIDNDLCEI